jgi:hypothetical protein
MGIITRIKLGSRFYNQNHNGKNDHHHQTILPIPKTAIGDLIIGRKGTGHF